MQFNRKKEKKQQGITLIALVVTVIVLIILAGVSIGMLIGDNGIITQAQKAKTDTEKATLKEKLDMIALEREMNDSLLSASGQDETDIFIEMMGDKEITQEDIGSFNEILQVYGKKLTTIHNASDIHKIGTDENYPLDGLYVLLEDISFAEQTWTPIGTMEEPFTGIFNGNNKTIDGLTLNNPEMNAGLLGVNSGSVKNVKLTNTKITSEHTFVGAIAGQNNGLIENCHVQGGTISGTGNDMWKDVNVEETRNGGSRIGGICGYNLGGDILNCENRGKINGTYQIGGIAGDSEGLNENNISHISNCKNYEAIFQTPGEEESTYAQTGGIVGCNYKYSMIENCYNEGTIIAQCTWQGGIAGVAQYIIQDCVNQGEIKNTATSSVTNIGGIVGFSTGSIYRCYNVANITTVSSSASNVGGIVGHNARTDSGSTLNKLMIEKCWNSGEVIGTTCVGGVVGRLGTDSNINSCYNIGNVSGAQRVGGVIGDTTTESGKSENLYNKGTVTASTNHVGGIVGILYSILENAYNTGTVNMTSASTTFGGITGYINTDIVKIDIVENCYYLNTSATKAIGNISTIDVSASKTSDEMKNLAQTLGEAFKNSTAGDGYPTLNWQE